MNTDVGGAGANRSGCTQAGAAGRGCHGGAGSPYYPMEVSILGFHWAEPGTACGARLSAGSRLMVGMISILWLVLVTTLAFADGLTKEADARALSERVMTEVGGGDIIKGLEQLRAFNVYSKEEFDNSLAQIKAQLPEMQKRFGRAIGYDFVTVEKIGDSLRQFVYLQKFEKNVLIWRFVFYKPQNRWLLNTFYFDDKVQLLFTY